MHSRHPEPSESELAIRLAAEPVCRVALILGPPDLTETAARLIHETSPRAMTLVPIECDDPALRPTLARVTEPPAGRRPDTLLLRDVARLGPADQRWLHELLERLAADPPARRPKILASSRIDLFEQVCNGAFYDELYYRLNAILITPDGAGRLPSKASTCSEAALVTGH